MVAKAVLKTPTSNIELPGTVLPWASTKLAAEVDGAVEEIFISEGRYVKKGQPLVKLRTRPFELQKNLALAEKQRVLVQLEELNTGTRKETLEAAQAALQQAQARLTLAINELKRTDNLYKDGVVSLNEFDGAKAEAEEAQALFEEKDAVLKKYVAGPRIEDIRQEEANLKAAEARIEIIEDDIERSTIRAPFNGYIVKKETEVGQWLEKGDPAISMISAHPLKVEVHLPQFHFNKIKYGTAARVILESRGPAQPDKEFKGKVIEKIVSGDPTSRTFPVRIKVSNTRSQISPGMLVKVVLEIKNKAGLNLYVPKDAIVRSPKDTKVWLVTKGKGKTHISQPVNVKTGAQLDTLVEILDPDPKLSPGDLVVVHGNERLKPNSQVKLVNRAE